ncbi:Fanconi anemia, complementation group L family protein [Acanthamoeba castellanii str. Neff]|uniref:Fanconi anemia, complementation group L family protein n=1 Tax=Acanthamoeba castellanii (strain ATCC 30010 / Neff) TaxID=1257118 RepID=L8HG57_ACACF|nr:Fanconi anemia, complementation group L family protein [Acanthamoeba castellanii str. Neff]ELR23431.1 Fanconi anemia, complementation group L family protein [Acanthamoeba castellanii str. Neff]
MEQPAGHATKRRRLGTEWAVAVERPRGTERMGDAAARVRCSPALRRRLAPHRAALRHRLAESNDAHSFLVEVADVLSKTTTGGGGGIGGVRSGGVPPRGGGFYSRVVAEIDAVGWSKLVSANDSLTRLSLRTTDEAGREHRLEVELMPDHPRTAPVCTTDLPQALALRWDPAQPSTLADVVRQFEEALRGYQALWAVLEDIDRHTWVLEPERPTLATSIRRIALGNHCSLQVVIDAAAPASVPQCRFLGSETRVAALRENLNANLDLWDEGQALHVNLGRVLGCELPGKEAAATGDRASIGCGICYALRFKGDIPTVLCSLASCNKAFHEACLVEWLRVLPSTRQSFGTLFGTCPYCSTQIVVKTRS